MSNNRKLTALEWFLDKLLKDGYIKRLPVLQFQQAKEMEKEQAIKLYYEYELYVMMNESDVMTFGQFYKQTYGGGEQ
jgi:hypothetical protein